MHQQGITFFSVLSVDFRVGRGKKGGPTVRPSFFPTRRGSTVSDKDDGLLTSNYVPGDIEIDIIADYHQGGWRSGG